ncbi:hypothetical protein [Halorussus halophilus]|uniref:hypothetical protein n=1 Tax=Halorussus halophilus TaxID=2650975 RepID=UPI001301218F|nr:hypothetical protein [Halorussus halophilus]
MTAREATDNSNATTHPADSETVEWTHTVATSRFLRGLTALSLGIFGGGALAVGGGAVFLTAKLLLAGQYTVALAILLALVFAAARFAPQHLALHRSWLSKSNPFYEGTKKLGWRGFVVASLFGLGVLWVGLQFGGVGFFVVVFGILAVPIVIVSALTSEGELDAESHALTYCGTDVDLSALDSFRRVGLGTLVVYQLSFVSGAMSARTPRFLVVPATVDESIRQAVETGVALDSPEYDPPNRAVQATLAAFGIGCLAFGGLLLTVEPSSSNSDAGIVLVYGALVVGVFGFIFLSLAVRSG